MKSLDIYFMANVGGGVLMAAAALFGIYVAYRIVTGVVGYWWKWIVSE